MSTLIESLEAANRHIYLGNQDVLFEKLRPFIERSERKYIIPTIGKETFAFLTTSVLDDPDIQEVKSILEEAVLHIAFFLGFSQLTLDFTSYGVSESENDQTKNLGWAEKKDLHRHYRNTGFEALDEALYKLEYYMDKFPMWRDSTAFSVFSEHFNRGTDEFQKYFNINNSRKTYISLKPIIREVHEQYFSPSIGVATVEQLKERTSQPIQKRATELCRAIEVAFTISKAVHTGSYLFTGESAVYKWESLPWEKHHITPTVDLLEFSKTKEIAAKTLLGKLHQHLQAHPDVFIHYHRPETKTHTRIQKLKSGLAF